ncbi:MAG: hypothetical protein IT438_13470 [Phycisphaerales bacterium]|nr:hypothetical protein [Phycisphaerales bacterium]
MFYAKLLTAAAMAAAVGVVVAPSHGAVIVDGLYRLNNHPDGSEDPPPYGARFDELFDATGGHDVITLDFNDINSSVFMTVNSVAGEIHIYGQAYGGRDVGSTYAADAYLGVYNFDFTYDLGVQQVPGDDDLWVVVPHHRNFGFITAPNSLGTIHLTDEAMGGYSLRLGDEDNDLGHRGFNGISGWGWMSYINNDGSVHPHVASTDWIFTATYVIPAPGASLALGLAGLFASRRRR